MKKAAFLLPVLFALLFQPVVRAEDDASAAGSAPAAAFEGGSEASGDAPTVPGDEGLIQAADRLRIGVYKERDLSGVFTVNKEGNINYPLLGDIHVEGLTSEELKAFLVESLGQDFIVNPQIQVDLVASSKKSVSILGQVHKPGNYLLSSNSTMVRLISQVGGFSADAASNNVKVMRADAEGKKTSFKVDVSKIMTGEIEDFKLEPGDLVYVDRLAKLQKEIEETKEQVTVLGQVQRPGNYLFTPGLTLVRLIAQASGFSAVASIGNVRVVRQYENKVFYVDAGAIMAGRADDVPLEPGDLVVVQESLF